MQIANVLKKTNRTSLICFQKDETVASSDEVDCAPEKTSSVLFPRGNLRFAAGDERQRVGSAARGQVVVQQAGEDWSGVASSQTLRRASEQKT